uniref:Uncharacterized protein n=1 Tax=viral metagenome TaxID=1070528 RepID=A0A6C0B8X5_9ZZZZ
MFIYANLGNWKKKYMKIVYNGLILYYSFNCGIVFINSYINLYWDTNDQ